MKHIEALLDDLEQQAIYLWVEDEKLRYRAPKGGLSDSVKQRIKADKADLMVFLQARQVAEQQTVKETFPQISSDTESQYEPFPLSEIQQAYWIGRQSHIELGNIATQVYQEWSISELDLDHLNQAWQQVMERHAVLRTVIREDGQQQVLAQSLDYAIAVSDLGHDEQKLHAVRKEMTDQIHQAGEWPLFDIRVSYLSGQTYLHFCIDMLIVDSWSIELLTNDWKTFYYQPDKKLPPLELSFRDYMLTAKAYEESSDRYKKAKKYWLDRLDTLPSSPKFPLSKDPNTLDVPEFTWSKRCLAASKWQALKNKAARHNLQPSALLLAVYGEVLGRWSQTPHFCLTQTFFHRLPFHAQVNDISGEFTSTILAEIDNRKEAPFIQRVKQIQKEFWNNLDNRYFSGVQVIRELNSHNKTSELMPVVFTNLLGMPEVSSDGWGERTHRIGQTSQVYLDHIVWEVDDELRLNWSSVDALFPPELLSQMFDSHLQLLDRLASDDEVWHHPHPLDLPPAQLEQRNSINDTKVPVSEALMHELFMAQAEKTPNNLAVIAVDKQLTYQELYQYSNHIGYWLRAQGAEPNQLVAVVIEKGWQQVAAVMGVLFSGAAYLPIDPSLPKERQAYLLEQSKVRFILTQEKFESQLPWPDNLERLVVDQLDTTAVLAPLEKVQTNLDLAYVIYTSGSTGNPKGVVIDHRGAVNTILDINRRFNVNAKDRVLALSALNFDLSVYDIFGLLAVGGAVVMPTAEGRRDPSHWDQLMQQHQVTMWNTVAALMQMLVEYQAGRINSNPSASATIPPYLRVVMMSGDWIPVDLPERIWKLWSETQIMSLGGATEASIWSIYYPITQVDSAWKSIPYGKPMDNQTFHVLNEQLEPCPTWVTGQLYIGGIGLALGYWQDEAKTQASFFTHPRTGERLYRTGDLGRYLDDGNIEFLGRKDFQVKIGGYRIELGEIEAHLLKHPKITKTIVAAVGESNHDKQLVAYIVTDEASSKKEHAAEDTQTVDQALHELPEGEVLKDPIARVQFKLKQRGIRQYESTLPETHLPEVTDNDADYISRQSYRQFLDGPISLAQLGQVLSCLKPRAFEHSVLPKYRYPSSGSLYPIQSYLYIHPEGVAGLAGGFYYYHPLEHKLLLLSDDAHIEQALYGGDNQVTFNQSAFSLFLVAEYDAIKPLYGDYARDLCLVEAGYMSQLLAMTTPEYDIGLCPIGGLNFAPLRERFGLGDSQEMVHSFLGGGISTEQKQQLVIASSSKPQEDKPESEPLETQLKAHLGEKLPSYMIPHIYVELSELPLTANGKVDRKALPHPDLNKHSAGFVKPSNALEGQLVELTQKLFKVESISLHDDFFNIGANSLDMVQLYNEVQTAFQRDVKMADIFTHTTVHKLAELLGEADVKETETDVSSSTMPNVDADLNAEQIDQLSVNLDNLTEAEIELLLAQLDTES
jgi:amino acid adenylation domain-containing protein